MIRIGMSTTCVYPLEPEHAFRIAKDAGFDGVEIMVSQEATTQDPEALVEMSERYELPILSIHAPVLLLTHFVWGRDPRVKLARTAELAKAVGAGSVVVHPPFRWQASYALEFLPIVRTLSEEHGVEIAVENMFPWRAAGRNMKAYAPGWDPRQMDCDAVTLDFSHAALSGTDSMQLATDLGERLRHVHLCDGSGAIGEGQIFDEHLLPGRGREPVAEVLRMLADQGWDGSIVAEVNTRKAKTESERLDMLRETVAFAREHTAVAPAPAPAEAPHESPLRRVIDAIIPGRHS
ncbi:sugar phosphate isomerase/epimerase [Agromyces binzhouensis]|uniref:Sugar phosphate isomerase/epimerase n=1 Tax=Agromyces binzhouensis TaxID=1817495 RepID=A0A4V1QSV4_9MICO|nr:sugar phosphate isomerase/epimerase [Agromyces binzhouensis]RXZ49703.1 sugar phosphate isomerase/epimerase [Agromyces binzhouensis]